MSDEIKEMHAGARMPGRKSGQLAVHVTDNEIARFDLRVDADAGEFIAVHSGLLYIAKTRKALEKYMVELMRAQRALTWTRYIVIDYEARVGTFGSGHTYNLGERRPAAVELSTLSLTWDVVDYSTAVQQPGATRARGKTRRVYHVDIDEDPNDPEFCLSNENHESWNHDDKIPSGAVKYTPERHALLVDIRNALGKLDARLNEMFSGEPDELAIQLDTARIGRLLGPGSDTE